jgi:hypothetical protein
MMFVEGSVRVRVYSYARERNVFLGVNMEERSFGKAARAAKGVLPATAKHIALARRAIVADSDMKAAWVPLSERRAAVRRRAVEAGRLGSAFDKPGECTITDISDSGANVVVKSDVNYVPKKVLLILLRKHVAYTAMVVWRKDGRVGLRFEHEHDLRNPTTPELQVLSLYCTAQHSASL